MDAKQEARELAAYLEGLSDGLVNPKLKQAAGLLNKLGKNMCSAGIVGCRNPGICKSDHK